MNNKKKALVSGLTGAALLLGGGATFALWQTEAFVGGESNSITLGTMSVSADVVWEDGWDVANWVPGDSANGTITVNASLLGDNLNAVLTHNGALDDLLVELQEEGLLAVDLNLNAAEILFGENEEPTVLTQGDYEAVVPFTVTFTNQGDRFWNTVDSVYGAGNHYEFDLSGMQITLTQVID